MDHTFASWQFCPKRRRAKPFTKITSSDALRAYVGYRHHAFVDLSLFLLGADKKQSAACRYQKGKADEQIPQADADIN